MFAPHRAVLGLIVLTISLVLMTACGGQRDGAPSGALPTTTASTTPLPTTTPAMPTTSAARPSGPPTSRREKPSAPPECVDAWRTGKFAPVHCEDYPEAYRAIRDEVDGD